MTMRYSGANHSGCVRSDSEMKTIEIFQEGFA